MNPARPIRVEASLVGLTLATTWAATWAWAPLMELPGRFLVPLAIIGVGMATVGIALRRMSPPRWLGLLIECTAAGVLFYLLMAPSPWEIGASGMARAWQQAVDSAATFRAPVPAPAPSIAPILVAAGVTLLVIADLLVSWLRRPALLGLVLLLAHVVPFVVVGKTPGLVTYVATASGFLTVLAVDRAAHVERWDSGLAGADSPSTAAPELAAGVGLVALVVSIVGALILPTWNLRHWDHGVGGSGTGDDISIQNPITDLQRDLLRGQDRPLLRVVTDDPDPSYIRIAVLTRFRNTMWSAGDRTFPSGQVADGTMPTPAGVDPSLSGKEHSYAFTALETFKSTWLPTPLTLSEIYAPGLWKYDTTTMDFLAAERDLTTQSISYRAVAKKPRLSGQRLATSAPPPLGIGNRYRQLPTDLPTVVSELADAVTAGQPSKFQEAQALQQWFRKDGNFTYSLDNAPTGSGSQALVTFLSAEDGGRVGYCEQFASAMAVMARVRGIPARVAVGFLSPEKTGPQTFEYSSHDLHAWPELYFTGAGWVRFEPTPAARAAAPGYTTERIAEIAVPSVSASASPQAPTQAPRSDVAPKKSSTDPAQESTLRVWFASGGVVVLLAAAAVPAFVRRRRRSQRVTSGDLEQVWSELRDLCLDLGRPWPHSRSPRETGRQLSGWLGDPTASTPGERPKSGVGVNVGAEAELARLVSWWEIDRYSSEAAAVTDTELQSAVEACSAALRAGASTRAQRAARLWPRSVFSRRAAADRTVASDREAGRLEDSLRG